MPFYYRYVDNLVIAVPTAEIDYVFSAFNSFHPRIQFTIEIGYNVINFWTPLLLLRITKSFSTGFTNLLFRVDT